MWKYITIFAYIGLAFGAFVFYKNFDAMVTEKGDETVDGEIITLQERFLTAIEKNKQRDFSETTQRYAEMREAWYKSEVEYYDKVTQRARELKEQYESETNATREKNRALQEDIDRLKSELDKTKRELAAIMEMEVSDDFNMAEFGKTVAALKHNNDTTELKVADEVRPSRTSMSRTSASPPCWRRPRRLTRSASCASLPRSSSAPSARLISSGTT